MPEICRTIAFSSVKTGNGCTWLVSRMADVMAACCSGSVCLVDANLRAPSLHRYFGVESPAHGLSQALGSSAALERITTQVGRNVWLVPCGSPQSRREPLPATEVLRARLIDLRSRFDWVVVDAPSLDAPGDAVSVARATDGLVMVLEANVTRRQAAIKATEALATANVRVVGAVLNKRTFPIPAKLYKLL
jgi:Mrp family chromosome partitioning ATPase